MTLYKYKACMDTLIIHLISLHYFSLHLSIMSSDTSPTPSTQPHTLNILGVLSETERIITAHSRHFLALSIVFLLPLSFYDAIFPFFFPLYYSANSSQPLLYFFITGNSNFLDKNQFAYQLLHALGMFLFCLFASASITNSAFHGFSGSPVKIVSSLKSVLFSFFPLLATIIAAQSVILIILINFGISIVCMYKVLVFFGVDIMVINSSASIVFALFISCLFVCVLVYLQIMWCLVHVVVVVESKWGFEALQRSMHLVKGMRRVAFQILILVGVLVEVLSMLFSVLMTNVDKSSGSGDWVTWGAFVVQAVFHGSFVTVLMVFSVAANTVLFMYCKAMHGELALDFVDEFSKEYVSLPFNDGGKVTNVVCVV